MTEQLVSTGATFTVKLGDIIDSEIPIWDTDDPYPIFDEAHRAILNKKIEQHYWFYEIGHETIEIFRFSLNRKMREVMPYFNQLYESEQVVTDPLATVDYTETTDAHNTNEQTSDTTNGSTAASRAVSSDTPQTRLSGDEDYASSATDSNSKSDTVGNAVSSGTTDGNIDRAVKGSQGHQAQLLMQYRKSILNIDMNVISELESLFMSVWDNGDEFAGSSSVAYGYGWSFYWIGSI